MNMKTKLAALLAASTFVAGAASATTISVSVFDIADWASATMDLAAVEDFEALGSAAGVGAVGGALDTAVGSFDTLGGIGGGNTCSLSGAGPACSSLALFNDTVNGQGNMVPDDGVWSLNSNDTLGMSWAAELDGAEFNRIVFGLMDAADIRATVTVEADGEVVTFSDLANNNQQLIVINFSTPQTLANIIISNNGALNDSFSVDGAAIGAVPVPAAGFLLLGGLGALAAVRRRKA